MRERMDRTMPKEFNKKSINDHLANERTLLAWVRTSIGIMAFGFVVVKFSLFMKQFLFLLGKDSVFPEQGYSSAVGIAIVLLGPLVLVLSYIKYKHTEKQISNGSFHPSSFLILSLIISIFIITLLLLFFLFETSEIF